MRGVLAALFTMPCATSVQAQDADAWGAAAFRAADTEVHAFERATITLPPGPNLHTVLESLTSQTAAASAEAQRLAGGFEPVRACRSAAWTIAALVRQGQIYDALARMLEAPTVSDPALAAALRARASSTFAPVECLAVVRYVLAVRAARTGAVASEPVRDATTRLAAYGPERVAACIDDQRTRDPSFGPFTETDLLPVVK